ncbi:DEAD/DEAH box helicase [Actinomadura kijaniata]|uniref:DEAD/DEAH box helicase n=1 Tax=Actinomadura kijaniata TaxID=46161 RepID=UPI000A970562
MSRETAQRRAGSEDPALWRLKALSTFAELGVVPEIADALKAEGIVDAFPIQELALPIALGGHDIIGQARTGTGKTLAFGIALLQRIRHGGKKPQALVLAPTRELAMQVTDDLLVAGGKLGTRVLSVYGGRAYEPQISALREGVDVVVGTPGRLLDLVKQKHLDLSEVAVLVLDEADRMLDLGFLPDIERIVDRIPVRRQTMLFSATMPGEIVALSRRYLTRPTNVRAESHAESETTPQVKQFVYQAHQMDKPEMLARVLQARGRGLSMVFCQTKRACDRVAADLEQRGFAAAAVHGDLGQGQRERALRAFRNGKIDVLVATDVAARGLDVDDVTHVVNYECPDSADTYVHRIGRTGRAGREGTSVTFVDWSDLPRWKLINGQLGQDLAQPEETYSTSPHLYAELDIPEDITGRLPKEQRGERAGLDAEELEDIGETGKTRSRTRDRDRDREREREEERPRQRRSRTRTRTRNGKPVEATAQDETAEVTTVVAEAPAEAETKPRRTRTRRAAEIVEAEVVVTTEAEVTAEAETTAEAKPKRTRTRKTAEAIVVEPAAQTEETEAKPKRTRKTAEIVEAEVEVATEAEVTAEAETPTEAKPKRTRTRKTAEAIVVEPAAQTEETEAKPKRTRTRKVAETVEAEVTAEAEAKPKRTRKAAEAVVAEPAVEAEEAEAKPERTRKTAVKAVVDAEVDAPADADADVAAEKPKRGGPARIPAKISPAGVPEVLFQPPPLPPGGESVVETVATERRRGPARRRSRGDRPAPEQAKAARGG